MFYRRRVKKLETAIKLKNRQLFETNLQLAGYKDFFNNIYYYSGNDPISKAQLELRQSVEELSKTGQGLMHFEELDSYLSRLINATYTLTKCQRPKLCQAHDWSERSPERGAHVLQTITDNNSKYLQKNGLIPFRRGYYHEEDLFRAEAAEALINTILFRPDTDKTSAAELRIYLYNAGVILQQLPINQLERKVSLEQLAKLNSLDPTAACGEWGGWAKDLAQGFRVKLPETPMFDEGTKQESYANVVK